MYEENIKNIITRSLDKKTSLKDDERDKLVKIIFDILKKEDRIHWRDTILDLSSALNEIDNAFIDLGTDYKE